MRTLPILATRFALIAAGALTITACGSEEPVNNQAAEVDSNVMFEELGNDASAMEAAGNADLVPPGETGNGAAQAPGGTETSSSSAAPQRDESPVLGETKGGDTGGNTVSNTSSQ